MSILEKIRSKSPEFRLMLAIGLAIIFTGIIATVYIIQLTSTGTFKSKSETPSPLNALFGSIKETFERDKPSLKISPDPEPSTVNTSNTEIIDASQQ